MPGFRQRFRDLFASGFQYIPYFIALVYGSVRLLPAEHPYLNPSNMGRFGIRHVLAEAANNIVFSTKNIDQILLFFCILFGLILMALQFGLLSIAIFMQPAMAAMPTTFPGFFSTAASGNEAQDIANILMDMVFGVPGIFNSCVSVGVPCTTIDGNPIATAAGAPGGTWSYDPTVFPFAIHRGLHQLFQLYNIGLTVVAAFIGMYFIFTIALETAESGTPMGKRFNKVWAPIRFVMAFGLLFPIGYGYNSAQYIVLYAAKYGSGFATNGWNLFNDTLNATYGSAFENLLNSDTASAANLVGVPNVPEVGGLLQFMYAAKVCTEAEAVAHAPPLPVKFYLVGDPLKLPENHLEVNNTNVSYAQLINFADGENQVIIRFGRRDEDKYGDLMGYVHPTCGELTFKLSDPRAPGTAEPGIETLQEYYWFILKELWFVTMEGNGPTPALTVPPYAQNLVKVKTFFSTAPTSYHQQGLNLHTTEWKTALQDFYRLDLREILTGTPSTPSTGILGALGTNGAAPEMRQSQRWQTDANLRDKGWAGAGIWYNRVADMNGALTTATLNIPMPSRYPHVMEKVYTKKRQGEQNVDFNERFNPTSTSSAATGGLKPIEEKIAPILWEAFDFFQKGGGVTTSHSAPTGNAMIDIMNTFLGTNGLFSMRQNSDVHPLAQLAGVGRSLIEASVRNLGYAGIGALTGTLVKNLDMTGEAAKIASGFIITFSTIGLTAGFVLFYVVPFLPFIYFFFAVGGWVKGIFEAMVGAPLWALAHLRIDGNGLAGQAAVSGYFLIFEVFLRPILIIFGLLASISIFSALVSVLNQTFDLVVANLGGFDTELELSGAAATSKVAEWRGAIDEFFFTVIYVIIVYLMGMSSFKLVDMIPNNILRWMGQSVATFGDQREDAGQSLIGTATVGSQQTLGAIGGGLKGLFK